MGSGNGSGSGIKTTSTVFSIIETVREFGEAGVTDVAEHLDLAPSTVYDHLTTLESEGYVVAGDDGYRLGLRFLSLGTHVRRHETVAHIVEPVLGDVAEETGEIAWFMVEESGEAVCVDCISGNGIRIPRRIGTRLPFHTNATGRALLAHLPEERKREIVARAADDDGSESIEDPDALRDDLDAIAERGYATRPDGDADGLDAVGVPVLRSDRVYGAIGVSGPRYRFSGPSREEVLELLEQAQNEIQVRIGRENWIDHDPRVY